MPDLVSLKEMTTQMVKKGTKGSPKGKRNSIYASIVYKDRVDQWYEKAPFDREIDIEGIGPVTWFSFPEFNHQRNKLESKCLFRCSSFVSEPSLQDV